MPYIAAEDRTAGHLHTAGDLTYQIALLQEQYRLDHGDNFQTFAEITAATECAKIEFYRRVIAPYEEQKIEINGDVYRPIRAIGKLK